MTHKRNRMQPVVAWRALRRLIANPEETHEVFTVIRALSGPALERAFARFRQTDVGRNVLDQKLELLDVLNDRAYLATLPAASLGRAYLAFVTSENLSADGLVEASDEEGHFDAMSEDFARFATRQRDMHDLWHTLTQYGRDELGEDCLLAFTYAQTRNRGIGLICLAGALKLREHYGRGVFRAAWRAYRQGKKAAWLPAQDWEHLLTQPIDEVRADLGVTPPTVYARLIAEPVPA